MSNTIAQGQITIMDYNDGVTLTSLIDINKPLVFQYNPTSGDLNPPVSETSSLILTPRVFKSGTLGDQISNVAQVNGTEPYWTYKTGASDTWEAINSTYETIGANKALTIKKNRLETQEQVTYRFRGSLHDDTTNFDIDTEAYITISRVINGTGAVIANIYCPQGNTFKNKAPNTLEVKAELLRGDSVDSEVTKYQWQQFSGTSWANIADATGKFSGSATDTLIIYADAVTSFMMVRCQITDTTDGATRTYTSAGQSIIDTEDPYKVELIASSQYLKNGIGNITIKANVYRNNALLDDVSGFNFVWTKIDSNGDTTELDDTTQTINISGDDVDVKATFVCTVSKK